ncbi:MAG: AGE family epimerase/isomerase [Lachnospiraceae bacterium]|nr:AGE family epimerase/isomerase [Lachnospiraceae bacterium]
MVKEAKKHLEEKIIPFWEKLKGPEFGGFYGFMDYSLNVDKKYVKGCILNSRILWFFSNAAMVLGRADLKPYADHAYRFMKDHCLDKVNGGIFWSLKYDGTPEETIKHTYNQAFAIYALSSYFDLTQDREALDIALGIQKVIEEKCTDEYGYLEAFDAGFNPIDNDKLSENGVMAEKTMNTLLHVLEAYTELLRVLKKYRDDLSDLSSCEEKTSGYLKKMLNTFADKIYNPSLHRQEVFFDKTWHTLIDLHSYGHDIETAWLVDRCAEILGDPAISEKVAPITNDLADKIYHRAYVNHSILNECERGKDDIKRVWWVQAEAVVSFVNSYQKDRTRTDYLEAARDIFTYILEKQTDGRDGSEWFMWTDENGEPIPDAPIVEPWKCPYHNGRMCLELIKRCL